MNLNLLDQTNVSLAGADPGFPVGGGANPPGAPTYDFANFWEKNCMKMRKFWAVEGGGGPAPPQIRHCLGKFSSLHY